MESSKRDIYTPLNKIDLRKELQDMETDYNIIKNNILNYQKDYEFTINSISMDDQESHLDKSQNINSLNLIQENLRNVLLKMKNRIDQIKNYFPDEKIENLDNKKILSDINNVYNKSTEELNILNSKITKMLAQENSKFNNAQEAIKNNYNKIAVEEERTKIKQQVELGKSENKKTNPVNFMTNQTIKERENEFKAIYELTKKMNEISKTFNSELSSQRIKTDTIEDAIKKSENNAKNANAEVKALNQNTESYKGIYLWIFIATFILFIIVALVIYYKYYR